MHQKKLSLAVRFDLNQCSMMKSEYIISTPKGNKQVEFNLLSLPVYAVEELPRLIEMMRESFNILK